MKTEYELVTLYLNEGDEWQGRPLYLEILEFLSRSGCAGATVVRAAAGFTAGLSAVPSTLEEEGRKLPLVLQFIDRPKKAAEVLPTLRKMTVMRLITVQKVQVIPPEPSAGKKRK